MKSRIGKAAEVLNKLLRINNDRIEYYKIASAKTAELNLKTIFNSIVVESQKNSTALIHEIIKSGKETIGSSTTTRSTFYLFWKEIKSIFTGKGSQSILNSCVPGEDAAQTAYLDAISSNELTMQSRQLVRNQQIGLKSSYDIMMAFRNGEPLLIPITL